MIPNPLLHQHWFVTLYPSTRLYRLLVYSLYLMQPYHIKMWRTFNVKWHLATYDEED